jgi:hypothetical protein
MQKSGPTRAGLLLFEQEGAESLLKTRTAAAVTAALLRPSAEKPLDTFPHKTVLVGRPEGGVEALPPLSQRRIIFREKRAFNAAFQFCSLQSSRCLLHPCTYKPSPNTVPHHSLAILYTVPGIRFHPNIDPGDRLCGGRI